MYVCMYRPMFKFSGVVFFFFLNNRSGRERYVSFPSSHIKRWLFFSSIHFLQSTTFRILCLFLELHMIIVHLEWAETNNPIPEIDHNFLSY